MNNLKYFLALLIVSASCTYTLAQTSTESIQEANNIAVTDTLVNDELDSAIRELLEISNSLETADLVFNHMIQSFSSGYLDVPDEFWRAIREDFSVEYLAELIIPIYKKYLTLEDVNGIIEFYQSPPGKKLVEVTPNITQESMVAGEKFGQQIALNFFERLIEDGFEKEEALEDFKRQIGI